MCMPWIARAVAEFPRIVASGESGMQLAFGMPIFEYLTQHPQESANFNRAMIASSAGEPAAVAEAYDFSGVRRLVDVGGGIGTLVATVLGRYPLVQGVLFDRPDVIDEARATLAEHGVAERCEVVGGDFFVAACPRRRRVPDVAHPPRLGRRPLHHDLAQLPQGDRPRRAAAARRNGPPTRRHAPPRQDARHVHARSNAGGMERTEEQYGELLHRGGFRLTRVVPTQSAVSVIEAVPDLDGA